MTSKGLQTNQGFGILLVILGALFLLGQISGFSFGRYGWPFFILLPGAALFAAALTGGKKAAALAIPASIVTTVGLILFYQNVTGRFETWAYAWALIAPTAVGVGTYLQGLWSGSAKLMERGRNMAVVGLSTFLGFAVFFELILNFSGMASGLLGKLAGPALLIGGGVIILMRQRDKPVLPQPEAAPENHLEA